VPRTDAHRVALDFDPAAIAAEVVALPAAWWVPHFNRAIYDGDWSGVALRSIGGQPGSIYPDTTQEHEWADTPLLAACPATAAVLERFGCPLTSVRFLRLGPGSSIRPHNDAALGFHHGEVRLHLPIVSDDAVSFWLAGEPVDMRPGECWYLDLDLEHRATNEGTQPRIHLVIDCVVDPWLEALFGYERRRPAPA
jgi:hypothetical protein